MNLCNKFYLGTIGIISSGKSTVVKTLERDYGFFAAHEPTNLEEGCRYKNYYLERFYAAMKDFYIKSSTIIPNITNYEQLQEWLIEAPFVYSEEKAIIRASLNNVQRISSMMQIALLHIRYHLHQECVWHQKSVSDSLLWTDHIFARMLHDNPFKFIDDIDFDTYTLALNNMKYTAVYPDVIIYLDVTPETAYRRYLERNRKGELLDIEYLRALKKYYDEFVTDMSKKCCLISIDWNQDNLPIEVILNKIEEANPKYLNFLGKLNDKRITQ